MKRISILLFFITLAYSGVFASELKEAASVKGRILEKSTGKPLEFATVVVKNQKDSLVYHTATDKSGTFIINKLNIGNYKLSYSFMGYDKVDSVRFEISSSHKKIDLGRLYIAERDILLDEVAVVGQRSTFVNSIDRKTFNVGQDLMSKSGSVSDLMRNIPSVQVDVDGVVSLRGSENVTILVNGQPSAMMSINPAATLQQMPASSIEKIEVITNPSAKYKPDGTAGIINIVMKKNKSLGLNCVVSANVGNNDRQNFSVLANYHPGNLNLFGSFGMRHDNRIRLNDISSTSLDTSNLASYAQTHSVNSSKPISYLANAGFDYKLNQSNNFGASVNMNFRDMVQLDSLQYSLQDNTHTTTLDYDRDKRRPEKESDIEFNANYQHKFDKAGHELNVNFIRSLSLEQEDNYFTNNYRVPVSLHNYDNLFYHHTNNESELSVEYSLPISEAAKFEAGYVFERFDNDMDIKRDTTDFLNNWHHDTQRSNRFIRKEETNVLYATYKKDLGKFGFLAGVRAEQTSSNAHLITLDSTITSTYTRLYPSLHLSYKLSDIHELQLNYSHRIRRPEDEDLNPFPEYQDMRNIRAGNPTLKPEDIHSFELGYQMKKNATTFLSTLYYRNSYNLITNIITTTDNNIYFTTLQNLARSQSAGLELILSSTLGKMVSFNLATNTFYNTIDASALGFSNNKSNITWSANGNASINLTKSTVWQVTSNYSAETLTPQGRRLPSFVMNSGLKQELFNKNAALILTVSDIFNSMKNKLIIDTHDLKRTEVRRRSSQIIYLGFTYSFGSSPKKSKESTIKYDNQL